MSPDPSGPTTPTTAADCASERSIIAGCSHRHICCYAWCPMPHQFIQQQPLPSTSFLIMHLRSLASPAPASMMICMPSECCPWTSEGSVVMPFVSEPIWLAFAANVYSDRLVATASLGLHSPQLITVSQRMTVARRIAGLLHPARMRDESCKGNEGLLHLAAEASSEASAASFSKSRRFCKMQGAFSSLTGICSR